MSKYGIQTRAWDFKYPPMPLEKRRALLPKRSVSSLYPAKADIDVMVTGNGKQRIDVIGEPYQERIIFKRERIMDMRWKNTPEPPDIAYAIPECRRLLLQGKFAEAFDNFLQPRKKVLMVGFNVCYQGDGGEEFQKAVLSKE